MDDGKNRMVIEQFINGLPHEYARQVRISGKTETITECVKFLRNVRGAEGGGGGNPAATAMAAATPASSMCYKCGDTGHLIRNCPKMKGSGQSGRQKSTGSFPFKCYFCDEVGHRKADCPERLKWQAGKTSKPKDQSAAAHSQDDDDDKCLCTPAAPRQRLPRIFVDLSIPASGLVKRVKAVVDTASTKNLIAKALVEDMEAAVLPSDITISAIDGKPLSISGMVTMNVARMDHQDVVLPETSTKLMIVDTLETLNADVVIGLELISALGGVDVRYSDGVLSSVVFGQRPKSSAVHVAM